MRIFAISDIHTDHKQNLDWVRKLAGQVLPSGLPEYCRLSDVLIVAGDVTHKPDIFRETFEILSDTFAHVFWCPGNHDLYLTRYNVPKY
jgi:3',5'-cyclic AMP phosphodiesterase CpdA